jgi:palmitoyltransferase
MHEWVALLFLVAAVVVMILFLVVWLKNPGYYPLQVEEGDLAHNTKVLMALLSKHEPFAVCAECQIVKPARSRHCEICQRCVAVYDHHCPWINNCVGCGNHKYFMIFITLVWFNLLLILIACIYYISEKYENHKDSNSFFNWFS